MNYTRDYLMSAAIFGMFSFCWLGWAQEKPRAEWRLWLGITSAIAFILGIAGGVLSYLHWNDISILKQNSSLHWFIIIFFSEILLIAIGAVFLLVKKHSTWVSLWVSFVVAIHFIGLKFVFADSSLFLLAFLMLLVTIGAVPLAKHFEVAPSAILGIGNGVCLLAFSILSFGRFILT
ncbi:hypothetical protein [Liquorilactobacillus uvarum]|uniref:hypothetical protein n=1 Tax=Liquorilactobacillus uvarum TaxID=303240 RepID=UPI0028891CC0|nr:hypothetical protein [Liquorilactobacillus uvarum]